MTESSESDLDRALIETAKADFNQLFQVLVGERVLAGYRAVVAEKVAPGTHDLVLTFEPAPGIAVYCTDESGR